MTEQDDQIKALSNAVRIDILRVLDEPKTYFSHQESADPAETGVCVQLLAEHFAVSQPTMSRHIELLKRANLLKTTRISKWTYCSRNEKGLRDYKIWIDKILNIKP